MDELTAGDLAVRACFQVSFDTLPGVGRPAVELDPAHAFRMLGVWPGLFDQPARPQPRSPASREGRWPTRSRCWSTPTCWTRRRLTGTGCHDLLRAYAAERARADEPEQAINDASRRLLDWYLRTADAAASVVAPHRDRVPLDPAEPGGEPVTFASAEQALAWVETGTRQPGHRHSPGRGPGPARRGLEASRRGRWSVFDRHGYRAEWLATHHIALDSARETGDRSGQARVLNNLGMVVGQQHQPDAIGYFEQAQVIYREIGDRASQARVANNLAFTCLILGRYEEAVTELFNALEMQRQVGHRYGEGVVLCNLAEAFVELGHHHDAINCSEQAIAIARAVGSMRDEGYALYNLGRAHLELGRSVKATGLFEQALAIHRSVADRYGEAHDLRLIGIAQVRAGRHAQAREMWGQARRLFESVGERRQAAELDEIHLSSPPVLGESLVKAGIHDLGMADGQERRKEVLDTFDDDDLCPDPLAAESKAELLQMLRDFRIWAGEPSFREMERRCGKAVSSATICKVLRGRRTAPAGDSASNRQVLRRRS